MRILNLCGRVATTAEIEAGVEDPPHELFQQIKGLHTFKKIPDKRELKSRAGILISIYQKLQIDSGIVYDAVMLDGEPYFIRMLGSFCKNHEIKMLHPFYLVTVADDDGELILVKKFTGFVQG